MSINWPSSPAEGATYVYGGVTYKFTSGVWVPVAASGGAVADGDKGDITVSSGGTVWTVDKQMSISSDAAGLKLSGDAATPGNNKTYGTDAAGLKGWKAGGVIRLKTTLILNTGAFIPDPAMLFGTSELWGGGGSGSSRNDGSPGGGGGGGGYSKKRWLPADVGASVAVTIGAGGTAPGIGTLSNGNAGATTAFGGLHSATGGVGGAYEGSSAGGGTGVGGDFNVGGSPGFHFYTVITVFFTIGGAAALGGGGGPAYSPGLSPGGGGGGGNNAAAPGPGAKGACLINEYCSA